MSANQYELILDSSQISEFLECAEKWNNSHVKLLVPSASLAGQQDKTAMNAGTYGHKILDIFYSSRASGCSPSDSIARALAYNPDLDTCTCGCSLDCHKKITVLGIEECGRCHKCLHFRPEPFALDGPTRQKVQNRIREYFFNYQSNDFEPLSPQHVEVGFSESIFENSENLFVLEGRIDLIGKLQGLPCIVDHKFQMRRHELYAKSIQFRNYALIAKSTMLLINYIRLANNVDKETLVRQPVCFTVPELLAWKKKLIEIFFRVKRARLEAERTGEPMEQNFGSCVGRFGYQCPYTTLCEEPSREVALMKEKQLYTIKENPWRPW